MGINDYCDTVFEWIPYNQFIGIKGIGKDGFTYSATWKDGPLYYDYFGKRGWMRKLSMQVVLECFHSSRHTVDEILNKVGMAFFLEFKYFIFLNVIINPTS